MKCTYEKIDMLDRIAGETFHIADAGGLLCHGIEIEGRIYVHGIMAPGKLKEIMKILTKKFKTNLITFAPLTNDNLEKSVKGGVVKEMAADHPDNPYGESFTYLECEWKNE